MSEASANDRKRLRQGKSRAPIVSVDPYRRYLREIGRFKVLSPEEEFRLATEFRRTGDPETAYRLVTSNLRLVVKIAFQFRSTWTNLLDLIQEGNVGLMLAVKKFDPFRGVRLPSYATWWIRAYMIKYILDNWKMVKVGTTNIRRKLLFNLNAEIRKLEKEGFKPEPKLLAERFGTSEADIIAVQKSLSGRDLSLDAPLDNEADRSLYDVISTGDGNQEEALYQKEFAHLVDTKLKELEEKLDDKERFILNHRLKAETPLTLQEIGDRFGVTREAIRQSESRLVRKLKEHMGRELKEYQGVTFDIHHPRS